MAAPQELSSYFTMSRDVFGHLKHGNLLFASKDSFEGIVSIDCKKACSLSVLAIFPPAAREEGGYSHVVKEHDIGRKLKSQPGFLNHFV
jgi:hypothetical protein